MRRYLCSVFAAGLAAAAPSFGQTTAGTAQFAQPPAPTCTGCLAAPSGTILLDASGGNVMHPLPSSQRNFASPADFAFFLQQNLNGTPTYDSAGNVVGVSTRLLQIGNTYYIDTSTNTIKPITDPIGAFIGGIPAQFTVAGVTYTTGVQGHAFLDPAIGTFSLPANVLHCKTYPPPTECILGRSWNSHESLLFVHISDSVGIQVSQQSGGYQESLSYCPLFGFIPWGCTTHSGTNQLTLTGTVFRDPLNPAANFPFSPTPHTNVTNITFSTSSSCFGTPGTGGTPLDGGTGTPGWRSCQSGPASTFVGACEQDTSAAVTSGGATIDGLTAGCTHPGVYCTSGYSLCSTPPFLNCTLLSADTLTRVSPFSGWTASE